MKDVITGRAGNSIVGKVLTPQFTINTEWGRLTVKTPLIRRILFKDGHNFAVDQIISKNGNSLSGTLEEKNVRFHSDEHGDLTIPRDAILVIAIDMLPPGKIPSLPV
jgi:hypothetical protein